ncbi:MAG TPA: M48 family metallopeptidase [Pirellulales bacterium]|jgi:predicted Zn-dependent protease|nr:M48 family metallopeptidase [Pirellulales bacterium]
MSMKLRSTAAVVYSGRSLGAVVAALGIGACLAGLGCEGPAEGRGEGPGHRAQVVALNSRQELELGRQAYREILSNPEKFGRVLPTDSPETQRVRAVAVRVIKATEIKPLMQEMNLHPGRFEWEINVLHSPQVNALCLPGGKMAVFLGLLQLVQNDDQLAAVIAHETAHALAHHVSERIAEAHQTGGSVLGQLRGKAFDRDQEAEADHIGVFLMTFAGYNPEEAVRLWQRMEQVSAGRPRVPQILSDHPTDEQRLRSIASWVPRAWAAKHAYEQGHIEPESRQAQRGTLPDLQVLQARPASQPSVAAQQAALVFVSASPEEKRQ